MKQNIHGAIDVSHIYSLCYSFGALCRNIVYGHGCVWIIHVGRYFITYSTVLYIE